MTTEAQVHPAGIFHGRCQVHGHLKMPGREPSWIPFLGLCCRAFKKDGILMLFTYPQTPHRAEERPRMRCMLHFVLPCGQQRPCGRQYTRPQLVPHQLSADPLSCHPVSTEGRGKDALVGLACGKLFRQSDLRQ